MIYKAPKSELTESGRVMSISQRVANIMRISNADSIIKYMKLSENSECLIKAKKYAQPCTNKLAGRT